jgi:hypothetical protein
MCHAPAVASLNNRDRFRSSAPSPWHPRHSASPWTSRSRPATSGPWPASVPLRRQGAGSPCHSRRAASRVAGSVIVRHSGGWANASPLMAEARSMSVINRMNEPVRYQWQQPRTRYQVAIGELDQKNKKVSSTHDARVLAASPEAGLPIPRQRAGQRVGLVTLRCLPGRWGATAGAGLFQLPEGADQARAQAKDDHQQQEGLVDGGEMGHAADQATGVPCVLALFCALRNRILRETPVAAARIGGAAGPEDIALSGS